MSYHFCLFISSTVVGQGVNIDLVLLVLLMNPWDVCIKFLSIWYDGISILLQKKCLTTTIKESLLYNQLVKKQLWLIIPACILP